MPQHSTVPRIVALGLVAALAAGCGGARRSAPTATAPAPSPTARASAPAAVAPTSDAVMMVHAAQDSLAEVRLGQLAARQGASEPVRQLGQQMVTDHTQTNSTLLPLAAQRGVVIPQSLDPKHQAAEQELSRLTGRAFDVAFLEQMIADHAKAIAMFERISATATDPALRAWAAQQLPLLRQHQATTLGLHAQLTRVGAPPSASPPTLR